MSPQTLPINAEYFRPMLELAPLYGFDLESILHRVDMNVEMIQRPNTYLSFHQMQRLVTEFSDESNIPNMGLIYGDSVKLASHGLAGLAAMTQVTLYDMLKAISRLATWAFPPIEVEYIEEFNLIGLTISTKIPLSKETYKFVMDVVVTTFIQAGRQLFPQSTIGLLGFGFEEPEHVQDYHDLFQCPINFSQENTYMLFSRELLSARPQLANAEASTQAEEAFYANTPVPPALSLPDKIIKLLERDLNSYRHSEAVARELSMSSRTLRRKLGEFDLTFKALLDQVRKEMAIKMLRDKRNSLTDIAMALHFCDSSAFSKAFKTWTGMTASEYLQQDRPH